MTSQADMDAYYELIMQLVDEAGQVSVLLLLSKEVSMRPAKLFRGEPKN
jgi:hypothetical protein